MSSIPTSKLARTRKYGAALSQIGIRTLNNKVKKIVRLPAKSDEEIQEENAKTIFNALSKLRGTALKMAQILSLETGFLPKKYTDELSKACYRVRPLNRAVIRKALKTELGDYPEKLFPEFDLHAFAAASLGQVHLAKDNDGNTLAIKVQYPGIDKTLKNDMGMVKMSVKLLANYPVMHKSIDEIEQRLIEEVDYEQEARHLVWFREELKKQTVIIPRCYPQYSSKRVLAMEYIDGQHLEAWLANKPGQSDKNQVAQDLFDAYCHCFFELHAFQADSNIGNYLFLPDNKVALLDFGCIKKVKADFPKYIVDLVAASQAKDKQAIIDAFSKLHLINDDNKHLVDQYYSELFVPIAEWTCLPYLTENFCFSTEDDYASSVYPLFQVIAMNQHFSNIDTDLIYFLRGLQGLYKMFEQMHVSIELQSRLPSYIA